MTFAFTQKYCLKSFYYLGLFSVLAAGLYYFAPIDWGKTYRLALSAPITYLLAVMALLLANFLSASIRLRGAYKQFGVHLDFPTAIKTTLMGQISSLLFIPLVGAMMGQKATLRNKNIPNSIIAAVHIYERVLLALSGIMLSLAGLYFHFQEYIAHIVKLQMQMGEPIIVICLVIGTLFILGLTTYEKEIFQKVFLWRSMRQTFIVLCNTVLTWGIMSSTYVIALKVLGGEVPVPALYSAAILTCFVASLPISINGWGVREFASVIFFGFVQVPAEQAIFVSMSIGVLSFLMPLALVGLKKFIPKERVSIEKNVALPSYDVLEQKLVTLIAYGTGIFIFFQFHLVVQDATININFADIFALCGLFIVGADYLFLRKKIHFRFTLIPYLILVSFGVFTLSLLIGFTSFGFTKWAFFSKYLGWFILMGYLVTGTLFANSVPSKALKRLLDIMLLTVSISMLFKLALYFFVPLLSIESYKLPYNFEGFAGNRNALCFQLLCMAGILLVRVPSVKFEEMKKRVWLASFLFSVIGMTLSRSGALTAMVLIITLIILQRWTFKQICYYVVCTACIGFAVYILRRPEVLSGMFKLCGSSFVCASSPFNPSQTDVSDHERFYTIFEGLKFWLQNPLFGKGLGYFTYTEQLAKGVPLVIHNTHVWLLAEFGLTGFAFFGFFSVYLFKNAFSKIRTHFKGKKPLPLPEGSVFCLLLISGMMGMVHDILYQRILWFILGLMIVKSGQQTQELQPLLKKNA